MQYAVVAKSPIELSSIKYNPKQQKKKKNSKQKIIMYTVR